MNQNDSGTTKPTTVDAGGEKPSRLSIDEAIKYLFTSEKQALIRLVNSALGENHDLDETELIELHTEFINRKTAPDDEPDGESFELVKRGYYLLLPFLLLRHRKGKKTDESARSLVEDIQKIEKAITELYENGLIYSNLRTNLYEVADGIAKNINAKYYDNNLEIDGELKKMGATRALYAQELVARGKAEITQVIRLFMQNKTAGEISKILGIPEQEVADILRETGLAGVSN